LHFWYENTETGAAMLSTYYKQATPAQYHEGSDWYETIFDWCHGRAHKYKLPVASVAGIVAALSQRVQWARALGSLMLA
jgi:hypothetical protein